ncbi:hypothetical protein [Nocardia flavorosea]|uniref:Uncharacterized protein n=1 Tax=Nocardia flavorosea TaxID=53429 RepID=A0A846YGA9_9NOCA|nr:hypothetical protein [Nocardia flavorosea]NKY55879.1 hypothetical protein [Nocardia flavorosea]
MNTPEQPILDVAHGDKALSQQATRALRILAQHSSDPDLKNQISDIASGRSSARELMNNPAFNHILDNVAPAAIRWAAETPAAERERLAEQGQADLDRLSMESTVPETQPTPPIDVADRPSGDSAANAPEASPSRNTQPARDPKKSWRDIVVTPDEPDEDDLYFQERRRRGWLE